jgi:hypothetical protein
MTDIQTQGGFAADPAASPGVSHTERASRRAAAGSLASCRLRARLSTPSRRAVARTCRLGASDKLGVMSMQALVGLQPV